VDADPEIDAALGREHGVSLRHLRLNFAGAAQRIDGAGKFGQQAVARGLNDAAVMRGDARIDQLNADRSEPSEGPQLVAADQPRVACHIRGEDGGKATGCGHFRQIAEQLLVEVST
jgi:hypothetical protein